MAEKASVPIEEYLKAIPAFAYFTDEQKQLLARVLHLRHYDAGELIFLEGEHSEGIWFVASGQVRIVKLSENGRVQALCVMHKGKCFGGCPLFSMMQNPATAQALTDVELLVLSNARLAQLQAQYADLVQVLLRIYAARLALLVKVSEQLGTWSTQQRIHGVLLNHARYVQDTYIVSLTHEEVAQLAGTVREVVSRHLAKLEKQKIVELTHGQIKILALHRLEGGCLLDKVPS